MNTILALRALTRNQPNITTQENHPPTTNPTSQLPGITALPIELRSLVVEYTVLHRISQNAPPFDELTAALELRLVCRIFSKEFLHALNTHITIAHLPQTSSTPLLLSFPQTPNKHALFSSAILNTCHTSPLPIVSRKLATCIINCLIVSSSISRADSSDSQWDLTFIEERSAHEYLVMDMLRRLCQAAGLSSCCQEYMCKPDAFYARYGKDGRWQADKHLEIAILVACGYEVRWIKGAMVRLARIGRLSGYGDESRTGGR